MSVSVVIPAFNAGKFVHHAIESVLAQTVTVDEIIVVDDGSSDNTAEVIRSFGGRVRLLSQSNQGASAARNAGVQAASSTFIAFLDSDDLWFPEKIATQLAAMRAAPRAVLCYTSMTIVTPDGTRKLHKAIPLNQLTKELRLTNPVRPTCVLVSREAFLEVGGFRIDQIVGEDWNLWLRLLQVGPFCLVEQPTALYSDGNVGLSSDGDELYREAGKMMERGHPTDCRGISKMIWQRLFMGHQIFGAAMAARGKDDTRREIGYLLLSIYWWPIPTKGIPRFKAIAVTFRNIMQSIQAVPSQSSRA